MHFSTFTTAIVAVLAASPLASATIYHGTRRNREGGLDQVAWSNGTPNVCGGYSVIVNGNGNPCGRDFWVDGWNGPFTLRGCGGNGLSLERNHQFNSNCRFVNKQIKCDDGAVIGINGRWECS